jgi:hypothetical protein
VWEERRSVISRNKSYFTNASSSLGSIKSSPLQVSVINYLTIRLRFSHKRPVYFSVLFVFVRCVVYVTGHPAVDTAH